MSNFQELTDFKNYWLNANVGQMSSTGRYTLNCRVSYHASKFSEQEISKVTILFNGYNEGQIDIDETGHLSDIQCHLRFTPSFQDYTFDSDNGTLVIEGSSEKMGGDYMVRIHPRMT